MDTRTNMKDGQWHPVSNLPRVRKLAGKHYRGFAGMYYPAKLVRWDGKQWTYSTECGHYHLKLDVAKDCARRWANQRNRDGVV